jgi:hypothetical protein
MTIEYLITTIDYTLLSFLLPFKFPIQAIEYADPLTLLYLVKYLTFSELRGMMLLILWPD